jgi:hypothetical protein
MGNDTGKRIMVDKLDFVHFIFIYFLLLRALNILFDWALRKIFAKLS